MVDTRTTSMWEHVWLNETNPVYKSGNAELTLFNPDLEPLQNPVLRYGWTDIMTPEHRERIAQYSKFLQKQVLQKFQELNYDGWRYVSKSEKMEKGEKETEGFEETEQEIPKEGSDGSEDSEQSEQDNEDNGPNGSSAIEGDQDDSQEWSDELKEATAIGGYLGCCVDTAFLFLPENSVTGEVMPRPISRNWCKDGYAYANDDRLITRADIRFPQLEHLRHDNKTEESFAEEIVPLYTQHNTNKNLMNSVVIQPRWNISEPFGECILKAELQTAYEKMYLRFYEMLSLHKGGILSETYVLPKNVDTSIVNRTKEEIVRGMAGYGKVILVPPNTDLNKQYSYNNVVMGKLDFATIASHINQDADLSKQAMEGGGAQPNNPNPFSGLSPIMNEQSDKKLKDRLSEIYKKIIKDVNYVLFDKDPKTYDIEFNKPASIIEQQKAQDEINRNLKKEEHIKNGRPDKALGKGSGEQSDRKRRGF